MFVLGVTVTQTWHDAEDKQAFPGGPVQHSLYRMLMFCFHVSEPCIRAQTSTELAVSHSDEENHTTAWDASLLSVQPPVQFIQPLFKISKKSLSARPHFQWSQEYS